MRYFVSISYNGKNYSGWQVQANAVSIQGMIEQAFSTLLGESISIVGAGRTDSGVNAINYIAHLDYNKDALSNTNHFLYKINSILPSDICINSIYEVKPDAHARFDATSRTYKYYIHTSNNPFIPEFSTFSKFPLNIDAMNKAASFLIGVRDFSCFEKLHGGNRTSICSLYSACWEKYTPELGGANDGYYVFTIVANRFLRNMVRAIVGTLLEVGRGKKDPEWILELLESKDRNSAGRSVPGNALFLTEIKYPDNIKIKKINLC